MEDGQLILVLILILVFDIMDCYFILWIFDKASIHLFVDLLKFTISFQN